jgi:hypothetical protein
LTVVTGGPDARCAHSGDFRLGWGHPAKPAGRPADSAAAQLFDSPTGSAWNRLLNELPGCGSNLLGDQHGYRHSEVVQSNQGLRVHSAARRWQRCVRTHQCCRTCRIDVSTKDNPFNTKLRAVAVRSLFCKLGAKTLARPPVHFRPHPPLAQAEESGGTRREARDGRRLGQERMTLFL